MSEISERLRHRQSPPSTDTSNDPALRPLTLCAIASPLSITLTAVQHNDDFFIPNDYSASPSTYTHSGHFSSRFPNRCVSLVASLATRCPEMEFRSEQVQGLVY